MIHINAFIKLSLSKMDKTALTISKTRQGSILAEGSIFAESTLFAEWRRCKLPYIVSDIWRVRVNVIFQPYVAILYRVSQKSTMYMK